MWWHAARVVSIRRCFGNSATDSRVQHEVVLRRVFFKAYNPSVFDGEIFVKDQDEARLLELAKRVSMSGLWFCVAACAAVHVCAGGAQPGSWGAVVNSTESVYTRCGTQPGEPRWQRGRAARHGA